MKHERITGVICTKNEEHNIAACIGCLKGVDEIVVADDGSTDKTVEIAESLGAKVIRRHDHRSTVTAEDVLGFARRFGWNPVYTEGFKVRNGYLERQEALAAASHDWVVVPDADERVSWNLPELRKLLPDADQIVGAFVHAHDEDGNPIRVSTNTKMFRRSMTEIAGRTHDVVIPNGRIVTTDLMRVDHWQAGDHSQGYVMPALEYSVLREDDQRSRFYLGREYYYAGRYDHSLNLLDLYLRDATWMPEIAQARLYAAACYWDTGRGDEARKSCLEAILINPDHKAALELYAEMHFEPWKSKWAFIAANATDKDILF
jgi:glycosyltransferase involved in cell wall biosynthesis